MKTLVNASFRMCKHHLKRQPFAPLRSILVEMLMMSVASGFTVYTPPPPPPGLQPDTKHLF